MKRVVVDDLENLAWALRDNKFIGYEYADGKVSGCMSLYVGTGKHIHPVAMLFKEDADEKPKKQG